MNRYKNCVLFIAAFCVVFLANCKRQSLGTLLEEKIPKLMEMAGCIIRGMRGMSISYCRLRRILLLLLDMESFACVLSSTAAGYVSKVIGLYLGGRKDESLRDK